jgi:hypothetical protein
VFIDTEAFRQAQFDWNGKALSKLVQFAKEGHLRLLTTDITKREVRSHLQVWLNPNQFEWSFGFAVRQFLSFFLGVLGVSLRSPALNRASQLFLSLQLHYRVIPGLAHG